MTKSNRLKKSPEEIQRNFDQLTECLILSSRSYDNNHMGEANRLAALIYTLCHDYGKSSISLLTQMNKKCIDFVNTCHPLNPKNLLTEMPMVQIHVSAGNTHQYIPLFDNLPFPAPEPLQRFLRWWDMPIMRDNKRRKYSRKRLVFHMRNVDGGGHVDPNIEEIFADIRRNNSMGWYTVRGEAQSFPEFGPEYATMRQIAWEIEMTLRENFRIQV